MRFTFGRKNMSYSLVFAREGIPDTDQAAWSWTEEMMEPYYADTRGPHPEFRKLHDRLVATYPCLCSLPDDEVDEGVWSDGPLIDNFMQDLGMVAFSYSREDEVLPFVLKTAANLRITVFDHQTHTIHRP